MNKILWTHINNEKALGNSFSDLVAGLSGDGGNNLEVEGSERFAKKEY